MSKKTKLVLDLLKPKASSLGFNKEELEGVAENIASNLPVDDDATDEALNAAVTKAVDAALPFLELSQKSANRIIQKNKEERERAEAEAKKKAEEEAAAKAEEERKAKEEAERKAAEEAGFQKFLESDWAKNLKLENEKLSLQLAEHQKATKKWQDDFKSLRDEFVAMKAERTKDTREKRLAGVLNGSGVFGERIRKNYEKMSFGTDEEFDEFLNGVKEDIQAFNQERANEGLKALGSPAGGAEEPGKIEPMSEAEIDALAAIM